MADFYANALILQDGREENPDPRSVRTQMEDGMVKQAATSSRVLVARPLKALLRSKAHYQAFKTWYYDTIGRTGWFNWTDPVDGVVKTARFVEGKVSFTPRRKNSESWIASFSIETWNT